MPIAITCDECGCEIDDACVCMSCYQDAGDYQDAGKNSPSSILQTLKDELFALRHDANVKGINEKDSEVIQAYYHIIKMLSVN